MFDLIETVNAYLRNNFPGVDTSTDIFEHAFLHFLGYNHIPEKCQFEPTEETTTILLRTPHEMPLEKFKADLEECIQDYPISMELAEPNEANFVLCLSVPTSLISLNIDLIYSSINYLLLQKEKHNFYKYWTDYAKKNGVVLSVRYLENTLMSSAESFDFSPQQLWDFVLTKANGTEEKLTIVRRNVHTNIEGWPKIVFHCKNEMDTEKEICLDRQAILRTIEDNSFEQFLISNNKSELILTADTKQFVRGRIKRDIFFKEDKFEIDLGYYLDKVKLDALNSYKFQYSTYRPQVSAERTRIYSFNKEDYCKVMLAFKEIEGVPCLTERVHQLNYYFENNYWSQLEHQLTFLINLPVDYTELAFTMFESAKRHSSEDLLEIVEKFLIKITENTLAKFPQAQIKKAHEALSEICMLKLNCVGEDTSEESIKIKMGFKEDLFCHAFGAKDRVSNPFLAELCGNDFGVELSNDIVNDTPRAILELAKEIRQLKEKVRELQSVEKLENSVEIPEHGVGRSNRYGLFQSAEILEETQSELARFHKLNLRSP